MIVKRIHVKMVENVRMELILTYVIVPQDTWVITVRKVISFYITLIILNA